jgi:hypothetical protein
VWMAPAWQEITSRTAQKSLAVMCPACSRSPDGLLALMEESDDLIAPAVKEWVCGDEKRAGPFLKKHRQGGVKIAIGRRICSYERLVHSRKQMAPYGAICELRTEFKMLLWSSLFW